jgi:hypothetical protein
MWMLVFVVFFFFFIANAATASVCERASEPPPFAKCLVLGGGCWFFLVVIWNKKVRETNCPLFYVQIFCFVETFPFGSLAALCVVRRDHGPEYLFLSMMHAPSEDTYSLVSRGKQSWIKM